MLAGEWADVEGLWVRVGACEASGGGPVREWEQVQVGVQQGVLVWMLVRVQVGVWVGVQVGVQVAGEGWGWMGWAGG